MINRLHCYMVARIHTEKVNSRTPELVYIANGIVACVVGRNKIVVTLYAPDLSLEEQTEQLKHTTADQEEQQHENPGLGHRAFSLDFGLLLLT